MKNENLDILYGILEKAQAVEVGSFGSSDFVLAPMQEIVEELEAGEDPVVLSVYGLRNDHSSFEFDLYYSEVEEGEVKNGVFYPKSNETITPLSSSFSVPAMDELVTIGINNGPRGAEGTSEPIWFFQQRKFWIPADIKKTFLDKNSHLVTFDEREYLSSMTALNDQRQGNVHEYWDTSLVFLSREEGESFGESRSYDYGEKDVDWRVYCISLWRTVKMKSMLSAIDTVNLESNRGTS